MHVAVGSPHGVLVHSGASGGAGGVEGSSGGSGGGGEGDGGGGDGGGGDGEGGGGDGGGSAAATGLSTSESTSSAIDGTRERSQQRVAECGIHARRSGCNVRVVRPHTALGGTVAPSPSTLCRAARARESAQPKLAKVWSFHSCAENVFRSYCL